MAKKFEELVKKMSPEAQERSKAGAEQILKGHNGITLTPEEVPLVFAALLAMTQDIHAGQDQLSEEEWDKAEELFTRFEVEMNARLGLRPT